MIQTVNSDSSVTPLVSIVTINYNGYNDTCALLNSLSRVTSVRLDIIVVDNASQSDDAERLRRAYPHVNVIASQHNLGFSGGNNLGIRQAKGNYIFLLNNDTELLITEGAPDTIASLVGLLSSSPTIGVVCPKIKFFADHTIQYAGFTPLSPVTLRNRSIGYGETDRGQYDRPCTTAFAHGAAMMLKRSAIEKAGLMPELYFLYYEEYDWSTKIQRAGYSIVYSPELTVYHKESQSTGQDSPLKTFYLTRNRLLYAYRNLPATRFALSFLYQFFAAGLCKAMLLALRGNRTNARAIVRGLFAFFTIKNKKQCLTL